MSERKKEMNDIKELSSFLSNLNKNILKINNQLNKTSIKINKTNTNFKNNNNNNNNNQKNDDENLFQSTKSRKNETKKTKTRNNSINLNLNRDFAQSFVQNKNRGKLDNSIKEMSDLINRTQQDLLSKNIIGENINKGKINPVLRHKPSASSLSSARVNLNINKIFDDVKDKNNNNEKKNDNITVNIRHVKTQNWAKIRVCP